MANVIKPMLLIRRECSVSSNLYLLRKPSRSRDGLRRSHPKGYNICPYVDRCRKTVVFFCNDCRFGGWMTEMCCRRIKIGRFLCVDLREVCADFKNKLATDACYRGTRVKQGQPHGCPCLILKFYL